MERPRLPPAGWQDRSHPGRPNPRGVNEGKPEGRYGFIFPQRNQARDTAWRYLRRYAEPLLATPPNESELRVDLVNGSMIRLYGADNPDALRGPYLDGVVLDEFADMKPEVWHEVVRPMLADRRGWATFIGTPKGKNESSGFTRTPSAIRLGST